MVKHIVLFKVKEFDTPQEKQQLLEEFRDALMGLKSKISCLVSIEAAINDNPAESFDLALTTVFNNYEDLETYAKTPRPCSGSINI